MYVVKSAKGYTMKCDSPSRSRYHSLTSKSNFLYFLPEICQVQTGTHKHTHRCFLLWKLEYTPHTAVHLEFCFALHWIFPNRLAYGWTSFHLVAA